MTSISYSFYVYSNHLFHVLCILRQCTNTWRTKTSSYLLFIHSLFYPFYYYYYYYSCLHYNNLTTSSKKLSPIMKRRTSCPCAKRFHIPPHTHTLPPSSRTVDPKRESTNTHTNYIITQANKKNRKDGGYRRCIMRASRTQWPLSLAHLY